ncbi:SMP-30/gluconolactonase/LRE family protein [Flaviflexus huanghaiensis]|uniref:SMP-30/gluconolactonase/LRE family protein n=1 Tax=Flaviflexus huanghaiensis TaxID=1111473 RepID=UPI0015FA1611|nr:SMP-30/gluconolactonase/LRE family protein [Flaviflexus huanghaiensis]
MKAEQITDPVAYHGEGPCWHRSWGGIRWVDMLAGDLLTLNAQGEVDRLHVGKVAAFVRPRSRGGYVVGLENTIGLATSAFSDPVPEPSFWSDTNLRFNEGGCDPWGNLYCGSMAYDRKEGAATLFRVSPSGEREKILPHVTTSNGIDFSPDGTRAYYNDTKLRRTDVFDVIDQRLINRRPFADSDGASPDGLTVDSAGNVWVAMNRHGKVRLYSPDAEVLAEIDLPVRLVTACTLGGPDFRTLYITTSRENLDDPEPEAGALFAAHVDVPGMPIAEYGG